MASILPLGVALNCTTKQPQPQTQVVAIIYRTNATHDLFVSLSLIYRYIYIDYSIVSRQMQEKSCGQTEKLGLAFWCGWIDQSDFQPLAKRLRKARQSRKPRIVAAVLYRGYMIR
jgi:hypothetical protein